MKGADKPSVQRASLEKGASSDLAQFPAAPLSYDWSQQSTGSLHPHLAQNQLMGDVDVGWSCFWFDMYFISWDGGGAVSYSVDFLKAI